jgi:formylmethanofuran dehydrogenase subunit E
MMDDNPVLVAAGRFHGHIGPFLAIGLRMGLLANEKLGRSPLDMEAVVRVLPRPPRSCVVDGVQYSTGCTMGKGNIRIEPDSDCVAVDFRLGSAAVRIALRDGFLKSMEADLGDAAEKAVIDYAFGIMDTPADHMFEVSG